MSSLLSCWASSGYTAEGCVVLETQLRACMDQPKSKDQPPNNINYHISRLYPLISGPRKKKT
ncbi:MAG: hypothetical protein M1834_003112 [Cirrosporium novae-zelandiae]|nr:MAG: hypothetical protein M1834_003112 [Cirrosporium novae-zelandiae]